MFTDADQDREPQGTEGRWDFWNGERAVFSTLAFLALILACLLREDLLPDGSRAVDGTWRGA